MRGPGSIPRGVLMWNRDSPVSVVCHIGDPNVIDHCGLVWGRLCPESSPGHCADNVIIPLDLKQLFCPGFSLAAGPPSGFMTDIVDCWRGALWRACNLTAFTSCLTGPVDYPFASRLEGPRFNPQGGYLCETEILLLALSATTLCIKVKWASNMYWSMKNKIKILREQQDSYALTQQSSMSQDT